MTEPTISSIRDDLAEAAAAKQERARLAEKNALLSRLIKLDAEAEAELVANKEQREQLKARKADLKAFREELETIADDESLSVEDLHEFLNRHDSLFGATTLQVVMVDSLAGMSDAINKLIATEVAKPRPLANGGVITGSLRPLSEARLCG